MRACARERETEQERESMRERANARDRTPKDKAESVARKLECVCGVCSREERCARKRRIEKGGRGGGCVLFGWGGREKKRQAMCVKRESKDNAGKATGGRRDRKWGREEG